MSEPEETAAQRQARIRRQKREAKINSTAAERLSKITQLSGRTADSMRQETSPSISGTTTPAATLSQTTSPQTQQSTPPMFQNANPEQAKMQEEYLKALLQGSAQRDAQGQAQGQAQDQPPLSEQEDPMLKMLGSLMGSMNGTGDPNASGGLPFNPDDLSKATGMPSFVTNMLMGNSKAPPTPAEIQSTKLWRMLHIVFALLSGIYYVFAIGTAEDTFGANPPAPATVQNPFVVFVLGEILLQSARILGPGASGKRGPKLWYQMVKEFAGDGAVIVFLLGAANWWKGVT